MLLAALRNEQNDASVSLSEGIAQLDIIGNILFLSSVICLLLVLNWGGTTYPWSNGRVIALFTLFGVLLIAFIGVQIWEGDGATGKRPRASLQNLLR